MWTTRLLICIWVIEVPILVYSALGGIFVAIVKLAEDLGYFKDG